MRFWSILLLPLWLMALPKELAVPGGIKLVSLSGVHPPVVRYEGALVPVVPAQNGWVAVVGIPLEKSSGVSSIDVAQGTQKSHIPFIIAPKRYKEQHIKLATNRHVQLGSNDQTRYLKEKEEIAAHLSRKSPMFPDFTLIHPVEGRLSSPFGLKRIYNGQPRSPHKGIDIAAPKGTPIKAAHDGMVVGVGDYFFNGKTVFVEHGQGVITMYCHLDTIAASEGASIKQGEILGTVGTTGRSTAPHLHFGVRLNDTWVDPELLLPEREDG